MYLFYFVFPSNLFFSYFTKYPRRNILEMWCFFLFFFFNKIKMVFHCGEFGGCCHRPHWPHTPGCSFGEMCDVSDSEQLSGDPRATYETI